jgi:hypothetical protein
MGLRRWFHRKLWGAGRTVRYIFIHPTCGQADVEAGYLPEWGRPKFHCRHCGVAFDEARVRLGWHGETEALQGRGGAGGQGR